MPYVGVGVRNQSVRPSGSGITRNTPLSAIIPSAVFDIDATVAASYTSGQLWQNLIPAPADGSAQGAYDFTLGASTSPSTDDPTFVGTAGSPAAYWSFDGGDWFQLASANTDFLNRLHRTDFSQPFTMGYIGSGPSGGLGFLGLWTANNDVPTAKGLAIWPRIGSNNHQFTLVGDTAAVTNNAAGVVSNTIYFVVYSYNPATNILRRWINGSTATEISFTRNTSVNNPSGRLAIGAIQGGGAKSASGSICYSAFAANAFLTDTDILAIGNHYELRHERNYV